MPSRLLLLGPCLLALASVRCPAAPWTPDPSLDHPELRRRLYDLGRRYGDGSFDPQANLSGSGVTYGADGKMIPNTRSHTVRESFTYAYGLLLTGDAADRTRAENILRRVLPTQDVRPNSPTRGVFLWYAEDNWETIKNPDLNAAAFMGMSILDILDLDRRRKVLDDPKLKQQLEDAARLAVDAILRRNVEPGYTNIALLSAAAATAGQKLLDIKGAGAFAEAKIDAVMKLTGNGLFTEYLCPTYLGVDIGAAYRLKKYAFSDTFAAKADAVINSVWRQTAAAYHAPTYQLAGPFCRAYGENMLDYSSGLKYPLFLALGGNYPLAAEDREHGWDQLGTVAMADLPITARPEFKQTPPAWQDFTVAIPGDSPRPPRHLFQYRRDNFVLGTVNLQDEWKQKRNLVAYWRNDGPPPAGVRVGFCLDESNETLPDGTPYGSFHFYSQQKEDAALVAIVGPPQLPTAGGLSLVFDDHATSIPSQGATAPLTVKDGTMTAYLYPVTTGAATFETNVEKHLLHVVRPWASADEIGSLHVLSYLVVFRPSNGTAPTVSDLQLQTADKGASVNARVDGHELSLTFQN